MSVISWLPLLRPHSLACLRIDDPVAAAAARLATGVGGLAPHRTGFAPAGRQTEFHDVIASSLPSDQPCLVAPCTNAYPKPRTSQPGVGHTVYPYLLRGLSIERPNQVWAPDICYIPMAHGFMYLVGFVGTYRTLCMAPEPGFRRILEGVRHLTVAA